MKYDVLERAHLSGFHLKVDESINSLELMEDNLLDLYRDQILQIIKENPQEYNLLNQFSFSKSLTYNFFFPLIEEKRIDILNHNLALNLENIKVSSFKEKMFDDSVVDFYLESNSKKVYFEIKYNEQDFGSKAIYNYSQTYSQVYPSIISKYFTSLTKDEFYRYYRLFMNFINVLKNNNPNDLFITVFPRKNIRLESDFSRFMTILNNKLINKYLIYKVRKIHLDELYDYVFNNIDQDLQNYYIEFKTKYLMN